MVSKIASRHQVNDEVEVLSIRKRELHVHEEGMVELAEEFLLVHDRVDTALGDDPRLGHFFHRVELLLLRLLNFPYFTETASSNHILECEVILIHL